MEQLHDRVAVITGAASGWPRVRVAGVQSGMRLALADVDEAGLLATGKLLATSTAQRAPTAERNLTS